MKTIHIAAHEAIRARQDKRRDMFRFDPALNHPQFVRRGPNLCGLIVSGLMWAFIICAVLFTAHCIYQAVAL